MNLHGKTIAILESRAAEQVAALIARHGGTPLSAPALAEVPVIGLETVRGLVDALTDEPPDVTIFQTGVGTRALLEAAALADSRIRLLALIEASVVVVRGPKPEAALRVAGVRIDRRATSPYTTEEVLQELIDLDLRGKRVLVQRYGETNERLASALAQQQAWTIEVPVYEWALPEDVAPLTRLMDALDENSVDAVVFTSAAQVRNLFAVSVQARREHALRRGLAACPVVSIGPACSATLRSFQVGVWTEASPPKLGHLIPAIAAALERSAKPTG